MFLSSVRGLWKEWHSPLLTMTIIGMVLVSMVFLGYEFWRLVFQMTYMGAVDLSYRYYEVNQYFSDNYIYATLGSSVYPPASYLMLWPFLGWLEWGQARWLWAITTVIYLIFLVRITLTAIPSVSAEDRKLRLFIGLLPLAVYGTGATIGNGQLPILSITALLASFLLLTRSEVSWQNDLLAAGLFVVALIKPTLTAPFFLVWLFFAGRKRPTILVLSIYLVLIFCASSFHEGNTIQHHIDWMKKGINGAMWGSSQSSAFNMYSLTHGGSAFEMAKYNLSSKNFLEYQFVHVSIQLTIAIIILCGIWLYFHNRVNIWIQISVAAFAARFWTYHRWYDDLVILLPMIALLRIATESSYNDNTRTVSGILFGFTFIFMLAPGGIFLFPAPWNSYYAIIQIIIWIADLVFMLKLGWDEKKSLSQVSGNLQNA